MIHVVTANEAKSRNSFGVAFDLLATGPQYGHQDALPKRERNPVSFASE
jgi:hypothetical protein